MTVVKIVAMPGPQGSNGIGNTGDITFENNSVIGAGTGSGDGYGNATLELVPDGSLNTDQYLIIDPTVPNHIHIRAGGTQDASTAELILGGEQTNVKVTDYNHTVAIMTYNPELDSNYYWYFQNDGTLSGPGMGNLLVYGIYGSSSDYPLPISSNDRVLLNGTNGEFLNNADIAENQIATIGDVASAKGSFNVKVVSQNPVDGITLYVLQDSDAGKILDMTSVDNWAITIPENPSIDPGSVIKVFNPMSIVYFNYSGPISVYGRTVGGLGGAYPYWSLSSSAGGTLTYMGDNIWHIESVGLFND